MSENDKLGEVVSLRFDPDQKQELEKVARANDRTFAAEVRRAVRSYLEGHPDLETEGKK